MPHAPQYKTMGGRTAIDEILDLDDSADQQRQVHQKYIRTHKTRPEGLYSPGMQQGGPPNMPQQMNEAEIKALVESVVAKLGASSPKDMGKVMGALQPQVKGRADGKLVSTLVKQSLAH